MALQDAPQAIARRYNFAQGRPLVCTPEFTGAVADEVRGGMSPLDATRHNGAGKTTFNRWMATARDIERRIEAGEEVVLTDSDERMCAFKDAVELAELDWFQSRLNDLQEVARPHRVRRTSVKEQILRNRGEVVYDANGEPVKVTLREITESEEAEGRLLLALLERRFESLRPTIRTELTGADGGPMAIDITATERRLGETIRPRLVAAQAETDEEIVDAEIVEAVTSPVAAVSEDDECEYVVVPSVLDYDV